MTPKRPSPLVSDEQLDEARTHQVCRAVVEEMAGLGRQLAPPWRPPETSRREGTAWRATIQPERERRSRRISRPAMKRVSMPCSVLVRPSDWPGEKIIRATFAGMSWVQCRRAPASHAIRGCRARNPRASVVPAWRWRGPCRPFEHPIVDKRSWPARRAAIRDEGCQHSRSPGGQSSSCGATISPSRQHQRRRGS